MKPIVSVAIAGVIACIITGFLAYGYRDYRYYKYDRVCIQSVTSAAVKEIP